LYSPFFTFEADRLGRACLFDFENTGKPKPLHPVLNVPPTKAQVETLKGNVEQSLKGDVTLSVDVLLTAAALIKEGVPLPDFFAEHIGQALEDAAIAFGHTEGKSEKRNAAVAKALGLTMPRGGKPPTQGQKQLIVHSYIWWRMHLHEESLYMAAKNAMNAFDGTNRLSHDACEKIYTEVENQRDLAHSEGAPRTNPDLTCFVVHRISPVFEGIIFNDDEFLKKIAPHVEDSHSNKAEFLELLGI
jgi:hypothetical protein